MRIPRAASAKIDELADAAGPLLAEATARLRESAPLSAVFPRRRRAPRPKPAARPRAPSEPAPKRRLSRELRSLLESSRSLDGPSWEVQLRASP